MAEATAKSAPGPAGAVAEAAAAATKALRGTRLLSEMRDEAVEIATTPKDQVWREDKVTLHRYRPLAEQKVRTPVLIVYGLIGRWTMADLQEDRSLVRNLLGQGIDLWVVDWGNPSRADRWLALDDYIEGYLGDCVDEIQTRTGSDKVSLLGICEGGVFTTCYAALEPDRVAALVNTITPIDFHADAAPGGEERLGYGFINLWTRNLPPEEIDRLIDAHGTLPGHFMGAVFSMMTPMRSLAEVQPRPGRGGRGRGEAAQLPAHGEVDRRPPRPPGRGRQAVAEGPLPAEQAGQNAFELGGRRVDLGRITMPVLNVYARDDHIIPPATSRALGALVGTQDYTELALPGGHVGVFVGGRAQKLLGPGIAEWLAKREQQQQQR